MVRGEAGCGADVGRFVCVLEVCAGCSRIAVVTVGQVGVGSLGVLIMVEWGEGEWLRGAAGREDEV